MAMYLFFVLVVLYAVIGGVGAQSDGWKMTDRFHGFRYSISTTTPTPLHATLLELATSNSCFGWSQTTPTSVVGEFRCPKTPGLALQIQVESLGAQIKVYEDTKIKLHFSRFKELSEERVTCFKDEPHKCGGGGDMGEGGGGDEL
ncbi:hypothetical protein TrLO_g10146 [Triparma laevis f. longispina]|uniref:Uncharacterized protein n=1 Tax=Triparma laevis f. longispina TaxID=1714387 RepID=A0A9W7E6X2_9STRA|nr:hypothetical protein TrLO_g10146 [Triparma laevis f. longispina]